MSQKVFQMPYSKIYPLLLQKALKKGRTQEEVDTVIHWLTGYTFDNIHQMLETDILATNVYTLGVYSDSYANLDYTKKIEIL